jgi:hypothetical protein
MQEPGGLEKAIEYWRNHCALSEHGTPGEDVACQSCPLNKPVHEYEEHPTYCEDLAEMDVQYDALPELRRNNV